jgi:chromate reductase
VTRVLLVSGSTRAASTNSAFVRTAAVCAPPGIETVRYGLTALPHFNPDDDRDPLPPTVSALRAGIASSDAVLFCTPEYAGTIPGALKNLLEWTVGGTEMADRPVAWVNVAADPARGGGAHATLATVLGYVGARVVADACRSIPVPREAVGADGLIADPGIRTAIAAALSALVAAV